MQANVHKGLDYNTIAIVLHSHSYFVFSLNISSSNWMSYNSTIGVGNITTSEEATSLSSLLNLVEHATHTAQLMRILDNHQIHAIVEYFTDVSP